MADDDLFLVTAGGRTIKVRRLSLAQSLMLQRFHGVQLGAYDKATAENDTEAATAAARKISDAFWTVVESQFVDPDDLSFVQLEILAGRVKEKDLYSLLRGGAAEQPDDDADPAPAKKAAKKAVKKATARRGSR